MSAERFVVGGPPRWRRTFHTSSAAAVESAQRCSRQFPNAVCTISEGLPGLQRVVAECNRDECYRVASLNARRRRKKAKKAKSRRR
jgi:hypothetical protein